MCLLNCKVNIASIIGLLALVYVSTSCTKAPLDQKDWELTFSDEFTDSIDWNVWHPFFEWGQQSYHTNQEYFIDSAYEVEDGILKIIGNRDTVIGNVFDEDWNVVQKKFYYTSGMIHSSKGFSQQYGYIETRAKVPMGYGLNSAFWMMAYSGWPPEIDVFEVLGREPNILRTTNHFTDKEKTHRQFSGSFDGSDLSKDFHVFGLEWNPSEIIWYLDGEKVFRSTTGVPDEPMYLIFSLGIGTDFPGYADETTPMPAEFQIDYVKAYQLKAH